MRLLSIFLPVVYFLLAPKHSAAEEVFRLTTEWARKVSPTTTLNLSVFSLGLTNSTCTATLISPKGHLLLARHCLESAVSLSNQIASEKSETAPHFFGFNKISEDFYIWNFDLPNIERLLEIPVGLDDKIVYAKIFASGKGYLTPRFTDELKDPAEIDKHKELSNEGYSVGGDFAIVQIAELKGKACYRLSRAVPKIGEKVRSISFPCFKKDDSSWPQIREADISNIALQADGMVENSAQGFFLPKGSFVTNGFAQECNSGTAVMNNRKEILGVFHTVFTDKNQKLRSVAISTARILELMPPTLGNELLELNSTCTGI